MADKTSRDAMWPNNASAGPSAAPDSTAASLEAVAKIIFGLSVKGLTDAAGFHLGAIGTTPEYERTQVFARDVVRVVETVTRLNSDTDRTLFLIMNYLIRSFGHKTALELVGAVRTDDLIGYLESLSAGYVG